MAKSNPSAPNIPWFPGSVTSQPPLCSAGFRGGYLECKQHRTLPPPSQHHQLDIIINISIYVYGAFTMYQAAAHQSLASKIFCLCCRDCEEPCAMDDSKVPSQTQEPQPSTCSLQKEEVASKNSTVDANEASRLPLGQPLIHPEKRASSTSNNEYEELNTHVCPRGFYKSNLNRYSQDHCPFQPCHTGRP
nr:testis-expressed protein 48 [Mirounga angustirostris]